MTVEPEEKVGRCWECGYLLRGLPTPRCPECGRRFDPADETSMNMGGDVSASKKWIMRPPGWPLHLLTGVALLISLWACVMPSRDGAFVDLIADIFVTRYGLRRLPWGTMFRLENPIQRFLAGFCLWSLIAVIWMARRIARGITVKRLSKRRAAPFAYWRRWLVTPIIFGLTVLVCRTRLPTYAGFWLSKPWLDLAALQAKANPYSRTIGLFQPVTRTSMWSSPLLTRPDQLFISETGVSIDLGGGNYFIFRKDGTPVPQWNQKRYRRLSSNWFWLLPSDSNS
jgi:hypothetical protein